MKVFKIGYDDYCVSPEGITSTEEFIAFMNEHYHSFVELTLFDTKDCVAPYFIKGQTKKIYKNVADIEEISEIEATVLSREEYDARLKVVVAQKCQDCENYKFDSDGDNLTGHRDRISLDGECWSYSKKEV